MSQKSILEQALLQVQTLEEAVKQNAKGILASTMKQELNDLLKESMEEEEFGKPDPEEEEKDIPDDESGDDDTSITDELPTDDTETESGDDELPMGDEELGLDDDEELDPNELEPDNDEDDETLDMTGASDDEVIKVFRAMKPEDGIVVKKEGDKIQFSVNDEDYIISLNEQDEYQNSDNDISDDTIYEISLDEEDDNECEECEKEVDENLQKGFKPKKVSFGKEIGKPTEVKEGSPQKGYKPAKVSFGKELPKPKEVKEGAPEDGFKPKSGFGGKETEVKESSRTIGNGVRPPAQKTKFKAGRPELNEEVEILRKQNKEYKNALILFKEKLNEVAVFNANLAYATRLFTEHTTTRQEKLNILKKFDSISTITESKNLYLQMKTDLGSKKTVTESVAERISSTPKTSSSTEVLSEAKAYENPQFKRMKELMGKMK
jgi:hypothetical protein